MTALGARVAYSTSTDFDMYCWERDATAVFNALRGTSTPQERSAYIASVLGKVVGGHYGELPLQTGGD